MRPAPAGAKTVLHRPPKKPPDMPEEDRFPMKKLAAFLLALLLLLTLTACADNAGGSDSGGSRTDRADGRGTTADASDPSAEDEGTVLIDNEYCSVTVTEVLPDADSGYTLKVRLENKSTDRRYAFYASDGAVNRLEWDPFFYEEVSAGEKVIGEIVFSDADLEQLIPAFTDIELHLRVADAEDWSADPAADETVHFYPLGEDGASVFVRQTQSTDTVLEDDEYCSAVVIGGPERDDPGLSVLLFLVNRTDEVIMISADDVFVNGIPCDPYWAKSIGPGNSCFSVMRWENEDLEENGITEVTEIRFTFRAYNDDDWDREDYFEKPVTLLP